MKYAAVEEEKEKEEEDFVIEAGHCNEQWRMEEWRLLWCQRCYGVKYKVGEPKMASSFHMGFSDKPSSHDMSGNDSCDV